MAFAAAAACCSHSHSFVSARAPVYLHMFVKELVSMGSSSLAHPRRRRVPPTAMGHD